MNSRTLIHIDRLFYLPYTILRYFTSTFSSPVSRQGGNVLILKFMGMGSLTRLASLCSESGVDKHKITLITFESQREICSLIGFGHSWYVRTSGIFAFLLDATRLIVKVWKSKPALIVDYERCSYAVGTYRFVLGWHTDAQIICFENTPSDYSRGRLKAFSINGLTLPEMFHAGIQAMPLSTGSLPEEAIEIDSKKILVNCNASDYLLARRFPANGFIRLVELLHRTFPDLEFYFTGSEDEFEYVEGMVAELGSKEINVMNMAGKWNLHQLSDELITCRLFITCDSGPLHIAAMMGIKTLVIWGPTQSEQFGYEKFSHIKNFSLHKSCSPCLLHPYSPAAKACGGTIPCMNSISSDHVFKQAVELLEGDDPTRLVHILPGLSVRKNRSVNFNPA